MTIVPVTSRITSLALTMALLLITLPLLAQQPPMTRASGAQLRIGTRNVTLATDTITNNDCGMLIAYNRSSSIAATLPIATSLLSGCWIQVTNIGSGAVVITPVTSTIDGAANLTLATGQGTMIIDATNQYLTQRGVGTPGPSGGVADPGSNGPMKRTGLNVTAPATGADIVGLFTSCNSSNPILGYLGACLPNSGGGGTGTVNPATQFGIPYYPNSGSASVVSGVTPPTNNGTYSYGYKVVAGVAVAPTVSLDGVTPRLIGGSTSTDTVVYSDNNNATIYKGSVAVAITLPTATTLGNPGFYSILANLTTGAPSNLTITPTTWTINGSSTAVIPQGQVCRLLTDPASATNWLTQCTDGPITAGTNVTITRTATGIVINSTGGGTSNPATGATNEVQVNNAGANAGGGCTMNSSVLTCGTSFGAGGACVAPGSVASPSSGAINYFCDSTNRNHFTAKINGGGLIDYESFKIGGIMVGSEDAAAVLITTNLTNHGFIINNGTAKVLSEASCISDTGDQPYTAMIGGTTLYTIHCVPRGTYSRGTTDGSTGYIIAASMGSTAIAAGAQIDMSGTANTSTRSISTQVYAGN